LHISFTAWEAVTYNADAAVRLTRSSAAIRRWVATGDVSRAHPYETKFLQSVLEKDKVIDRFRKYFGGKKGKKR
jgi:hypothetical protein